MRQIRFAAIAFVSLVAAIASSFIDPGTFFHRTLSFTLCSVLGFTSNLCYANLARNSGDRAVAAIPPTEQTQNTAPALDFSPYFQSTRPEFEQPNSSPANPPTSAPPNVPGNSDRRSKPGTQPQNVSASGQEFQSGNTKVREIRSKTYEVVKTTAEGCQVTRVLNALANRPYIESVKFDPLNLDTCRTGSYLFRFQPDGRRVEVQFNPNDTLIVELITDQTAKLTYRNSSGQPEVYELPYSQGVNTSSKLLNKTKPSKSSRTEDFLKVRTANYLIADVNNIVNDLSCGICNFLKTAWDLTFGETSVDVKSASLVDDLLSLINPNVGSKIGFLINQFVGNFSNIEKALQGTSDLGINCDNITVGSEEIDCKNRDNITDNQEQPSPPAPLPQPSPNPINPKPEQDCDCYNNPPPYRPRSSPYEPTQYYKDCYFGFLLVPSESEYQGERSLKPDGCDK